jgi:ribosomal protein S18 acetylase RimI-like enzyme
MMIERVGMEDIQAWIDLARDVEPLLEGLVADMDRVYEGFEEYMARKVRQQEALMAVVASPRQCLGIIAFSRKRNSITFFAVHQRCRGRGIGTELLTHALKELDGCKEVTAFAFREGYKSGEPSQRIYRKFGFVPCDNTLYDCGVPVCLMKKAPAQPA